MVGNGKARVKTIPIDRCLAAAVTCWMLLAVATPARGDDPKHQLLVEFVPPSAFAEPLASTNLAGGSGTVSAIDGEAAFRAIQEPFRKRTAADRWEQFEIEFGIHKRDPSLVKGSLESAKYRLDETVFALNEFVHNMENRLSFDYELRSLGQPANPNESSRTASSSSIPLWDAVQNAHFKSDIDLDAARGHAFVGVSLVLPIGD